MACYLWGPPHTQVEPESTYCWVSDWECDFYFGYGHDVIEENALNEKYCLEVVRRMTAKAHTEIDELEKGLVSFKSELAWNEHDEWPDKCHGAKSEQIAWLDTSVWNLKIKEEKDTEVQSLMHREPSEMIHEIKKDLPQKCILEEDEQPAKTNILDSSLDSSAAYSDYFKMLSMSKSEHSRQSEAEGLDIGPEEEYSKRRSDETFNDATKEHALVAKETREYDIFNNGQLANMKSNPDSSRCSAGCSSKQEISTKNDSETSRQCEAKGEGKTPGENDTSCVIFNNKQPAQTSVTDSNALRLKAGYCEARKASSSCDSDRHQLWEAKGQSFCSENKEVISKASPNCEDKSMQNSQVKIITTNNSCNMGGMDKKTSHESSVSKVINQVQEDTSIPTESILGSSLRPDGCESDVYKTVEPADIDANSILTCENRCTNEVSSSCMPGFTESKCAETKKQPSTATTRSQTVISSTPKMKGALQKTRNPGSSLVKYSGQDALRRSAGINKRNECLEARSHASRETKGKNSDAEQKLIDFVPTTSLVDTKESNMTLGNKIGSLYTSSRTGGSGRSHRQTVKVQGWITDEKDHDQTAVTKETQKAEDAGLNKAILTLELKPQRPNRKRKSPPLNPQDVQETLYQLFSSKHFQNSIEQCAEDKEHDTSLGITKTSASLVQKKSRRTSSLPVTADNMKEQTVNLGLQDSHRDLPKKRKVTSTFKCPAEVKDLSTNLSLQDSQRDATKGCIEKDLQLLGKKDANILDSSQSQTKRKKTSSFKRPAETKDLSSGLGLQNLCKIRNVIDGCCIEENPHIESYSGDDPEARDSVPHANPTPSQRLMGMKLDDLRRLAKRLNLTSYHKIRKMELVERIARNIDGN